MGSVAAVDALKRARRLFPLTPAGLAALALVAAGYFYGWRSEQDYVLYMVAAAVGGLLVVLTVLVVLSAFLLSRRLPRARTPSDLQLETETWQETGFAVPFPRWLPCVTLEWAWEVAGRDDAEVRLRAERGILHEVVRPARRGLHEHIQRRVRLQDVLHLASISWTARESRHVRILPARGNLDRLPLLYTLFQSDELSDPRGEPFGDRVDMRQYVRGDPPRMILWKVYARTRKLMVRVPERAITAQPRTCAWLASGAADEPSAALARVVLERGMLGDGWRFGADGSTEFASHVQAALELVARSGNLQVPVHPVQAFSTFLEQAERDGYMACLLFAPPDSRAWAEAVEPLVRRSHVRLCVLIGVDHIDDEAALPRWQRVFLRAQAPPDGAGARPPQVVDRQALARSVDRWRELGTALYLVSRDAGRVVELADAFDPVRGSRVGAGGSR